MAYFKQKRAVSAALDSYLRKKFPDVKDLNPGVDPLANSVRR